MGYFSSYQSKNVIDKKDVKLWRYPLSDQEFHSLTEILQFSNEINLDPIDATIYYAEWWRRYYNGGKPSKESVFESIQGNIQFNLDAHNFYKFAKKGAEILGIKWITKQNTLYFRTLLLQGGLPLNHISENTSNYKNFLLAVLEEQPEKIEDFIFLTHITNLLPPSSRNDVIYENCFEIVKSILNNENYYEQLFSSNESIKEITDALKVKKNTLEKKVRYSKPQNYWLLDDLENTICLRIGFADKYSPESLAQVFGFNPIEKNYQFYLNDELICVFRKMLNGHYKTDWHSQFHKEWSKVPQMPFAYVISADHRINVKDFIQIMPNLDKPSLWSPYSDNLWRLNKGYAVSADKALLMFPENWECENEFATKNLYSRPIKFFEFEGETILTHDEASKIRYYKTSVAAFDWTIVTHKPDWVLRSNMPIVRGMPEILVYDEKNQKVSPNNYSVFLKYRAPNEEWQVFDDIRQLPLGCIDIKIIKDDIVAYDSCFNIGNLNVSFSNQSLNTAVVSLSNNHFSFRLEENPLLEITSHQNSFSLKLNQKYFKIPTSINASLKIGTAKSLMFELHSPFQGIEMLNYEGKIIDENKTLTFKNLHGLRILTPNNANAAIKMHNELRRDVVILKESKINSQPLISFKDELLRLYYLDDAMNYRNRVKIELSCGNQTKTFCITGFTHTLDVGDQLSRKVKLYNSKDNLELFAVPLNCKPEEINLIPLHFQDLEYIIPNCDFTNQFILISSKDSETQLMPRFVNIDENFIGTDKNVRIESYCQELKNSDFQCDNWKKLLAYFNICVNHNLPFSTFDQIRSISRNSSVAARAFFFLGVNQFDIEEYIQKSLPEMEKDLGVCFHWLNKEAWINSLEEICEHMGAENRHFILEILLKYLNNNNLDQLALFFNGVKPNVNPVLNPTINNIRSSLGAKVLSQLPRSIPHINSYYDIPSVDHQNVFLLINSPVAVAESILDVPTQFPIWNGDDFREKIRRNIQYCQYLTPEFYNHVILHVLKK